MIGWLKRRWQSPAPVTRVIITPVDCGIGMACTVHCEGMMIVEAHDASRAAQYQRIESGGEITFRMAAKEST